MKISNFMAPSTRLDKAKGRHRTDYRAARRNIAKIAYRKAKRDLRS